MEGDEAKALFRRYIDELANRGNMDAADELVAETVIEHEAPQPGSPSGRAGVKHVFVLLRRAYPDIRVTVEDQRADGDRVVSCVVCCGTHLGEFMGIPASGNLVQYEAIDIVRISEGRVVEHWGVTDTFASMTPRCVRCQRGRVASRTDIATRRLNSVPSSALTVGQERGIHPRSAPLRSSNAVEYVTRSLLLGDSLASWSPVVGLAPTQPSARSRSRSASTSARDERKPGPWTTSSIAQ